MKTYQITFYVGGCEVTGPVSAETKEKAKQIATLMCLQSGGKPKTVKIK